MANYDINDPFVQQLVSTIDTTLSQVKVINSIINRDSEVVTLPSLSVLHYMPPGVIINSMINRGSEIFTLPQPKHITLHATHCDN